VVLSSGQPLGEGVLFWANSLTRIAVAITAVPVVEEIFWRAFLLRALIDWNNFEKLPLGAFTWMSFLGTALLSTVQHPDTWVVSIFCWFAFNGLMYWTRSLLCLVICHGVTNLVLYAWVLFVGLYLEDARAWWLW
jgi:CAAX prenyl protease-like protein